MSSLIKVINRFIGKVIYVLLFDVFNGCLVLLKKSLISKGMYAILFDVFNRCLFKLKN